VPNVQSGRSACSGAGDDAMKPFRDLPSNVARAQREANEGDENWCVCRLWRNYLVMSESSARDWILHPKHQGGEIVETCEPEVGS